MWMTRMCNRNSIYHTAMMKVYRRAVIRRQIQEIDVSYGKSLSEKRLGYVLRTERAQTRELTNYPVPSKATKVTTILTIK